MTKRPDDVWYLYRVRFGAERDYFFLLSCDEDPQRLLSVRGRIVVFRKKEQARRIIQKWAPKRQHLLPLLWVDDPMTSDLGDCIRRMLVGESDVNTRLLNTMNILLEGVDTLGIEMPSGFRSRLHALANHLTFEKSMRAFWRKHRKDKRKIESALWWCLGVLSGGIVEH